MRFFFFFFFFPCLCGWNRKLCFSINENIPKVHSFIFVLDCMILRNIQPFNHLCWTSLIYSSPLSICHLQAAVSVEYVLGVARLLRVVNLRQQLYSHWLLSTNRPISKNSYVISFQPTKVLCNYQMTEMVEPFPGVTIRWAFRKIALKCWWGPTKYFYQWPLNMLAHINTWCIKDIKDKICP